MLRRRGANNGSPSKPHNHHFGKHLGGGSPGKHHRGDHHGGRHHRHLVGDDKLIADAMEAESVARLLLAGDLLAKVADKSKLTDQHREILQMAERTRAARDLFMAPFATGGWKKVTEVHNERDTLVYFKVAGDNTMTLRIETVAEESIIEPVLAVLREVELGPTWMPSFQKPKFGLTRSSVLHSRGYGNQIAVQVFSASPFKDREFYIHGYSADCLEEDGSLIVKVEPLHTGDTRDGYQIPEKARRWMVQGDMDAAFMFRRCPTNHPALAKSKRLFPKGERLMLIQNTLTLDAKISFVPLSFLNFISRAVVANSWEMIFKVAGEIRAGKRPLFAEAKARNKDIYDWINSRIQYMYEVNKKEIQEDPEAPLVLVDEPSREVKAGNLFQCFCPNPAEA